MKIKLLENDKIIEVPNYWNWHLVEGKKVIIDQNKKNNCFSSRGIIRNVLIYKCIITIYFIINNSYINRTLGRHIVQSLVAENCMLFSCLFLIYLMYKYIQICL